MLTCPNCHKPAIPLMRVAFSRDFCCPNCRAHVRQKLKLRHVLLGIPFLVLFIVAHVWPDLGMVNELVMLAIAASVAFTSMAAMIELELAE